MAVDPDITFKQDDTWPPIRAILSDTNGPIDLTGATVHFIMKGLTVTVQGTCAIDNAAAGSVSYAWATGDLAVADDYNAEWEITFSNGKIETIPNDGYKIVRVKADLN